MKQLHANSLSDLPQVARELLQTLRGRTLVAFWGGMGAGKTTLIRAVCAALGVEETVSSPTFALVNEYADAKGASIYHFDFYRIDRLEEAYDLGYEEYFYSGNLCLIEWPEKIEPLLPRQGVMHVQIETLDAHTRLITLDTEPPI